MQMSMDTLPPALAKPIQRFSNWSHTFTPALVNQARAGVVRTTPDVRVPVGPLGAVTPSVLGINITPDIATGPPELYFDSSGLSTGFSGGGPTSVREYRLCILRRSFVDQRAA